jgi:hypothetical protein
MAGKCGHCSMRVASWTETRTKPKQRARRNSFESVERAQELGLIGVRVEQTGRPLYGSPRQKTRPMRIRDTNPKQPTRTNRTCLRHMSGSVRVERGDDPDKTGHVRVMSGSVRGKNA